VWNFVTRAEHKLRVLEDRVQLRTTCEDKWGCKDKWEEVTGGWRKLHNQEPH